MKMQNKHSKEGAARVCWG